MQRKNKTAQQRMQTDWKLNVKPPVTPSKERKPQNVEVVNDTRIEKSDFLLSTDRRLLATDELSETEIGLINKLKKIIETVHNLPEGDHRGVRISKRKNRR